MVPKPPKPLVRVSIALASLISIFLFLDRFGPCFGQPEWRLNQASHVARNYTNSELDKYCRLTDINRINVYLDNILIPRTVDSENHMKVSVYIRTTLESLGYRTEFYPFTNETVVGPRKFMNIVATRHPLARRRLVLACHYDSKEFTSIKFVGATDSALPCALLLDIAFTLQESMPERPFNDLTLQLLFFDGEEAFKFWDSSDSLYGSKYMADVWASQMYPPFSFHKTKEIDRIDVMVLLDLLGAPNPTIRNYVSSNEGKIFSLLPDIEEQLAKIPGCLAVIPRIFEPFDSYVQLQDDHLPFIHYKVKVVHIIPWPFPSVWHTERDNREALDTPTIENLSVILRVFVLRYLGL